MFNYRIYAKLPESKKYYPLGGGSTVKNIMYAEHWETYEACKRALESIAAMNTDIQFKIFDVNANKYIV